MSPLDIIPSSFFNKPWHRFRNTSGEGIPAYACMRIVDAIEVDNDIVFEVEKPNDEDQPFYLVNGPLAVPANTAEGENQAAVEKEGRATTLMQAGYVLVSGGPTFGDVWGPTDGSWEVSEAGRGFLMLGSAVSDPTRAVAVQQSATAGEYATATLAEPMCGAVSGEEVAIIDFQIQSSAVFSGDIPTTVFNWLQRQAPANYLVHIHHYLFDPVTGDEFDHWAVVAAQARREDHMFDMRIKSDKTAIEVRVYENAVLESCKEPIWKDKIPLEQCDPA